VCVCVCVCVCVLVLADEALSASDAAAIAADPLRLLHGYLSGAPSGPMAGLAHGHKPLFAFVMHCERGEIAFSPKLESIESSVLDIINIADKVSTPSTELTKPNTCVFEVMYCQAPPLSFSSRSLGRGPREG
jgi:hypothetical protein